MPAPLGVERRAYSKDDLTASGAVGIHESISGCELLRDSPCGPALEKRFGYTEGLH